MGSRMPIRNTSPCDLCITRSIISLNDCGFINQLILRYSRTSGVDNRLPHHDSLIAPPSQLQLLPKLLPHPSRDSSVGIATRYGLDGPVIDSRWGRDFPHLSRPAMRPTSTIGTESFPGLRCGRALTLTPHPLLIPRSKIEESYTSTLRKGLRGL